MPTKRSYRTRNWREYNKGLIQRGSLTIWFDEETLDCWYSPPMEDLKNIALKRLPAA